jgi:hypothetical protein
VIEHGRRKILHFNVTRHPTADWVIQQLCEAFPEAGLYRYAIRSHAQCAGAALPRWAPQLGHTCWKPGTARFRGGLHLLHQAAGISAAARKFQSICLPTAVYVADLPASSCLPVAHRLQFQYQSVLPGNSGRGSTQFKDEPLWCACLQ